MNNHVHKAPWALSLIISTALASSLCMIVAVFILNDAEDAERWLFILPLLVVGIAALFTVRGYALSADFLRIHRLLWSTRIPLAGLQSATYDPEAVHKSSRSFGNGGLFSISGYFRSKKLGKYRAFISHPALAVVLRFADHIVVVSPAIPEQFIRQLRELGALPAERG
jgi:hypothetical protein